MSIFANKKRMFGNSLNNYILNSEKLRRNNNLHLKKKFEETDLYIIPTVNNFIDLLYKMHISKFHQGYLKLRDKIYELKIFYHGINSDIMEIKYLCFICAQKI